MVAHRRGQSTTMWGRVAGAALLTGGTALGASALASTPPSAANVRGRLVGWEKLVPKVYANVADPHRSSWREPLPASKPGARLPAASVSRDLCVALLSPSAAPQEPTTVMLTGGRLTPSTLVVSPGTRVLFKNVDPFPHALFEVGDEKWGPNPMGAGATREWVAERAGVHTIHDQAFASVAGYVRVDAEAALEGTPDRAGTFGLVAPPGDYTLRVFFEGAPVGPKASVHLAEGGAVDLRDPLDLTLGDPQ